MSQPPPPGGGSTGGTAPSLDCLWCGRTWQAADAGDLEALARLCPDCLGRADANPFLRFRLHAALEARARASALPRATVAVDLAGRPTHEDELVPYYEARAGEYDDWYLRRGPYAHGPVDDLAWQMELDTATMWLDGLPLSGEIVELASGTGWWSALLATKGELHAYDASSAPLDRARDRLVAHGLRAHLHVRDAWLAPDRTVDGLFTGFWLSHVPRHRLAEFLALARAWLHPGGVYAAIDSQRDPASGKADRLPQPAPDLARRRLSDGREFTIPKVHYRADELAAALQSAGFTDVAVGSSGRFFLLVTAIAA